MKHKTQETLMKIYKRYSTHDLKRKQSFNGEKLFSKNNVKEKVIDTGDTLFL